MKRAATLKWTGVKEVANRKQEVVQEVVQAKIRNFEQGTSVF